MFLDEKKSGEARTGAFLPAAALGIEERERDALVKALAILESGRIAARPANSTSTGLGQYSAVVPPFFDMGMMVRQTDCGTSCCILGLARCVANDRSLLQIAANEDHTARALFFPHGQAIKCTDPKKGAKALRSYLETGDPRWAEALS